MKKVLKLISVLVVLTMALSLTAFADVSVTTTYPASAGSFTQSFSGLSALPDGWSTIHGGSVTENFTSPGTTGTYFGLGSSNGTMILRKDATCTLINNTYTATYKFGSAGNSDNANNPREVYIDVAAGAKRSSAKTINTNGYTVVVHCGNSFGNTLRAYKDGTQIGETVTLSAKPTPNDMEAVVTVSATAFDVKLYDASNTATPIAAINVADNAPDKTGYFGLGYSLGKTANAYIKEITVSDAGTSNETITNHLAYYHMNESYNTLAADGFAYTHHASNTDISMPVIDEKGVNLCIRESSTDVKRFGGTMLYNEALSGNYSLEYKTSFAMNTLVNYINYTGANSRYYLQIGNYKPDGSATVSGVVLKARKGTSTDTSIACSEYYIDGEKQEAYADAASNIFSASSKTNNIKIDVAQAASKATITVTINNGTNTYKYVFEDASAPLTQGQVGFYASGCGDTWVNDIKISNGTLGISQDFDSAGGKVNVSTFVKGNLKFISALYKDNFEMIDIAVGSVADVTNGSIAMFNASEVENADYMKTYIWSSFDSLIPVATVLGPDTK